MRTGTMLASYQREGQLTLHTHDDWSVEAMAVFLEAVNNLYALFTVLEIPQGEPNPRLSTPTLSFLEVLSRASVGRIQSIQITSLVRKDRPLLINRVHISSPGFFEFIGALNPLKHVSDIAQKYMEEKTKRQQITEQEKTKRLDISAAFAGKKIECQTQLFLKYLDTYPTLKKSDSSEIRELFQKMTLRALQDTQQLDNVVDVQFKELE